MLPVMIGPTAATIPEMLPEVSFVPYVVLPIDPPETMALLLSIDPVIVTLPRIELHAAMRPPTKPMLAAVPPLLMMTSPIMLARLNTWPLSDPLALMPPRRMGEPVEGVNNVPMFPWAATTPVRSRAGATRLIMLPRLMT